MTTLAGLSPVSVNGQVAIPKEIRDELGLKAGVRVLFRISELDPDVIEMVPESVLIRRYERAQSIERLERQAEIARAAETDLDATGQIR